MHVWLEPLWLLPVISSFRRQTGIVETEDMTSVFNFDHSLSLLGTFIDLVWQLRREIDQQIARIDSAQTSVPSHITSQADRPSDALSIARLSELRSLHNDLDLVNVLPQSDLSDPQMILQQHRLQDLQKSCSILAGILIHQLSDSPGRLACADADTFRVFWTCPRRVRALCKKMEFVSAELTELINTLATPTDSLESRQISSEEAQQEPGSANNAIGFGDISQASAESPFVEGKDISLDVEGDLSAKTEILQDFFLERLAFRSMTEREDEVPTAHSDTFEWLFSDESIAFKPWLEKKSEQSHLSFWISGKAGSGKSTLVRFLAGHEQTHASLSTWAGAKHLLRANFYFWTSGTPEQRSQAGLLRYIIWQLASQRRELISHAFSGMWEKFRSMSTKDRIVTPIIWTTEILCNALKKLVNQAVKSSCRICLFIDGLDELEGNLGNIVTFFNSLNVHGGSGLKIVLSSRSWSIFSTAFKNNPSLKLQELTAKDLRRYFVDKLSQHTVFAQIQNPNVARFEAVIEECVQKANGVFLWADIVTSRILSPRGRLLSYDGLFSEIYNLPSDLDELFTFLLFEVQPIEEQSAACQILRILRAREDVCNSILDGSVDSTTLWDLALANQYSLVDNSKTETQRIRVEEVRKICQTSATLITQSCAGLLRIHDRNTRLEGNQILSDEDSEACFNLAHQRIKYLHRTFRDFLVLSGIWGAIIDRSGGKRFEPHFKNVLSITLQFKLCFEQPRQQRTLNDWYPRITLAMTHARLLVGMQNDEKIQELLLDMDRTLSSLWKKRPFRENDSWSRACFGSFEEREKNKSAIYAPFESLATKYAVESFIRAQCQSGLPPYAEGRPLLSYAVEFLFNRRSTVFPLSRPEMVKTLLLHGHDPNTCYVEFGGGMSTPWEDLLRFIREAVRRQWIDEYDTSDEGLPRWSLIIEAFVQAGADMNARLKKTKWDPEASATDVFRQLYECCTCQVTEGLVQRMANLGQLN